MRVSECETSERTSWPCRAEVIEWLLAPDSLDWPARMRSTHTGTANPSTLSLSTALPLTMTRSLLSLPSLLLSLSLACAVTGQSLPIHRSAWLPAPHFHTPPPAKLSAPSRSTHSAVVLCSSIIFDDVDGDQFERVVGDDFVGVCCGRLEHRNHADFDHRSRKHNSGRGLLFRHCLGTRQIPPGLHLQSHSGGQLARTPVSGHRSRRPEPSQA